MVGQRLLRLPPAPRQRVGTFPARAGNSTDQVHPDLPAVPDAGERALCAYIALFAAGLRAPPA